MVKNDLRKLVNIKPIFKNSYIKYYKFTYKNTKNYYVMCHISALQLLKLNKELNLNISLKLKNYLERNLLN
jgi:hypothetical protein